MRSREFHGVRRAYGGSLARFANPVMTEPTPRDKVSIDPDHPALRDGRSIFISRVFDAGERDRVLISGVNNAKIGKRVTKGPWAGMPIHMLSLEERATCPRSCAVWAECYGNKMPVAVRFRYTPGLMMSLDEELAALNKSRPSGFVVRLHVLGDIPDLAYILHWAAWLDEYQALRVWGFTAHPRDSEIGLVLRRLNGTRSDRWMYRFSVPSGAAQAPMQTTVLWKKPATFKLNDGAIVCPQEVGGTATCGTCGLCWNPEAAHIRIQFLGHGGSTK